MEDLLQKGWVTPSYRRAFESVTSSISDLITPLFAEEPLLRIHGDFHCGNILDRMEEGLMVIDFDDMAMGPAVQDIWLLLPGSATECRREFFSSP